MDSQNISSIGSMTTLIDIAAHLQELDLSANQISSWLEIRYLLESLPLLNNLNLALNPLSINLQQFPAAQASTYFTDLGFADDYPSLRTIVLNNTKISWIHIIHFLRHFSRLQSLYISSNEYHSPIRLMHAALQPEPDASTHSSGDTSLWSMYQQLKEPTQLLQQTSIHCLYFNDNGANHWLEICQLGRLFPSLSQLVILNNALSDNLDGLDQDLKENFTHLSQLIVSENPIQQWNTVDAFNHLPSLYDLKIVNVPLLQEFSEEDNRNHLVARLPRITRLNGSDIPEDERDRAERLFLRHFMHQEPDEQPKRCAELFEIHGPLEPFANINLSPPSTACVIVHCHDANGVPLTSSKSHSIGLDQSVGQLKEELCQTFAEALQHAPPRQVRLFYWDKVMGQVYGRDEMKFPVRAVHSYLVEDGDELFLELKTRIHSSSSVTE